MTGQAPVIVIGAGIIVMCAANYLQRSGLKLTVLDAFGPANSCSFGNAGALSSGSCVPLAMPGATSEMADRRHGSSRGRLEILTTCATLALAVRGGQSIGRGGAQRRCADCSHASAV